ncbi:MAG TPA: DUF1295 domain-containing protein [Candidatus Bathyarchaeia archaeon]|nr:DUF1295 domain-containing protein [Candidatus Bathyarchaeia archaeon]
MSNEAWFPNEPLMYSILLLVSLGIALIVFVVLFFVTAGYGRHGSEQWGPRINSNLGWFIMEVPTIIIMGLCYLVSEKRNSITHIVFLGIWLAHYAHRVFIYPFRIRNGKKMAINVMLMGFVFNLINTYIQGRWLYLFSTDTYVGKALLFPLSNAIYDIKWLYSPQFIVGFTIFVFGFFINKQSDHILRNLRKPGDKERYKIPSGGLYRRLSCPNYFGEILEWMGWAVLTWSIAGVYFTFWTTANLLPRAISHHKWYKENFDDYPEDRKALIPFLL